MNSVRALLTPTNLVSAVFLLGVTLAIVAPSLLTPYDPFTTNAAQAFQPPSLQHPFGTDQVGRDVWARIAYGARTSVLVGLAASILALIIGASLGSAASLVGRAANYSLSRGVEVLMALPEFLLALFVIALLGPGTVSVFIALSIAAIPAYVNVSRASALTARSSESVLTARVMGLSSTRIFARYVAVEAIQPAIALFSLGVSFTILTAASLSFLGLGVQAPTPDWGLMLAEARDYLARAWWLITFPGIALTATVASFAVFGRAVQRSMR